MNLYLVTAVAVLLFVVLLAAHAPRDDSDGPNGRSGLAVRTDALTGCQYLEGSRGGVTPRLDRLGKRVCK